jgi:hypothetical protein
MPQEVSRNLATAVAGASVRISVRGNQGTSQRAVSLGLRRFADARLLVEVGYDVAKGRAAERCRTH